MPVEVSALKARLLTCVVLTSCAVVTSASIAQAQIAATRETHFGAPCPAATPHDRWCLPDEAVIGRVVFVPGGATRVLRIEVPPGRQISRLQLTLQSRGIDCGCAIFDVRRNDALVASVCRAYERRPAGRGSFDVPRINGQIVTVAFRNQEPYIQEPYLRVYYLE